MDRLGLLPTADDIVIHAAVEIQEVLDIEKETDRHKLKDVWPQIVMATHVDFGNPYIQPNHELFTPPDLNHFLAVRCRAVSAMERYGPNINGDAFPADELKKACHTLIGKGFYVEHASHDPRNAIGIIASAHYLDDEQYVVAVALVDKKRFPELANKIRASLQKGQAGVSIGCIAGEAQCSICGNIARKRYQICECMDRSRPFCKKGKRLPDGTLAHDICRNLTNYELSYTRAPADKDAMPYVVLGAEAEEAPAKAPEKAEAPSATISMPDETEISKLVSKEVEQSVKSFVHKLVKGEIDRRLSDEFRNIQHQIKPIIRKMVREYQLVS
jgi:hypothetical protein